MLGMSGGATTPRMIHDELDSDEDTLNRRAERDPGIDSIDLTESDPGVTMISNSNMEWSR